MDVSKKSRKLTLPKNDKIRVLAISVVDEDPGLSPAQPLYDTLNRTGQGKTIVASAP